MDNHYFIKLTLAVYRVTEIFPEKEPLKAKIREKADDILANLIFISKENPDVKNKDLIETLDDDIRVINSFFEIAKAQNWLNPGNLLVLKREYDKISQLIKNFTKAQIEESKKDEKATFPKRKTSVSSLNQRQEKILKLLEKEEKLQVWEAKKIFPEVSKRTLRRDFEQLLGQGLVKRIGERNSTFYQLVRP